MKKSIKKYSKGKRVISSENFPKIPMEDDVITSPLEKTPLPPIKPKRKKPMKKKKNVKKYAVGGDLRMAPPSGMDDLDPGGMVLPYTPGGGGGGGDDTATGQVKQVSKSAARAAERLKGAGQAQQQVGSMLGNSIGKSGPMLPDDPLYSPAMGKGLVGIGGSPFKGGGKVKKPAKKRVKKNMGGMMNYSNGGKVRGVGRAVQKKIRPAKMVSMKGS